jgi:hypothetical protein
LFLIKDAHGTLRLFGSTEPSLRSAAGRALTRTGRVADRPALAVLHMMGAHISAHSSASGQNGGPQTAALCDATERTKDRKPCFAVLALRRLADQGGAPGAAGVRPHRCPVNKLRHRLLSDGLSAEGSLMLFPRG